MDWEDVNVLVTGGASFIGSHLSEALLAIGARVTVIDDLSSGREEYVPEEADFIPAHLLHWLEDPQLGEHLDGVDTIFHLAADHGGRGYVDTHQVACARNMGLDSLLFHRAEKAGVRKIVYASSGCVYPNFLQTDPTEEFYLDESSVGPPFDADNMYGWAKLMGEKTLEAYAQETALETASCRYFTVYGPRGKVDHAIIAILMRAYVGQDPFVVWGDGRQVRNWTYVTDIVTGTIKCAELIEDGTAVNLGTEARNTVNSAVDIACVELAGYHPLIQYDRDAPTGPVNRVASNELASQLLGWSPQVNLRAGMEKTWGWLTSTYTQDEVRGMLETRLMER